MQEKYIAIVDHVGRTIIGKEIAQTETTLIVNNPVILHCQPEQNGSLNVQTFPLFFFEFIDKTKRENNNWTYTKSNIVLSDVELISYLSIILSSNSVHDILTIKDIPLD